jgi:putative oxidoreductase
MNRSDLVAYAALLLRLALGIMFLAHAWMKYAVFTPAGTAKYFQSLGLPGFVAYLTIMAEAGGGTLLILGVATSLVSLALVPLILGTIVLVHGAKGWPFTNEGGGWEYPAFWAVALVVQAMLGGGALALWPRLGIGWF